VVVVLVGVVVLVVLESILLGAPAVPSPWRWPRSGWKD